MNCNLATMGQVDKLTPEESRARTEMARQYTYELRKRGIPTMMAPEKGSQGYDAWVAAGKPAGLTEAQMVLVQKGFQEYTKGGGKMPWWVLALGAGGLLFLL